MRGMTDYKKLAIYYLKASKRRSMITIIGVAITVIVLYAGLNLAYSFFLNGREEVRKEADYEIVFLTEDNEKLAQIAADDRIIRAYTGSYETMEPDGNGDWIDDAYALDASADKTAPVFSGALMGNMVSLMSSAASRHASAALSEKQIKHLFEQSTLMVLEEANVTRTHVDKDLHLVPQF